VRKQIRKAVKRLGVDVGLKATQNELPCQLQAELVTGPKNMHETI
jgi:hypothetical protein